MCDLGSWALQNLYDASFINLQQRWDHELSFVFDRYFSLLSSFLSILR